MFQKGTVGGKNNSSIINSKTKLFEILSSDNNFAINYLGKHRISHKKLYMTLKVDLSKDMTIDCSATNKFVVVKTKLKTNLQI